MIVEEEVYLQNDPVVAFLDHHGVKGMHWGIITEDKPSGSNSLLKTKMSEVRARKQSGMPPEVAMDLAIGAGILLGRVTYTMIDSGRFHSLVTRGKKFVQGKRGSPWRKKPELAASNMSSDEIMKKVVKDINKTGGIGSKANCMRCSFAYEMRRRGYDVEATRTPDASGQHTRNLYKVVTPKSQRKETPYREFVRNSVNGKVKSSPKTIFADLAKQPNGARGNLGLQWKALGAHNVAWEIVKGKPVIFDAQANIKYESAKEFSKISNNARTMGFTRTDNIPLNEKFLMRWLKDA